MIDDDTPRRMTDSELSDALRSVYDEDSPNDLLAYDLSDHFQLSSENPDSFDVERDAIRGWNLMFSDTVEADSAIAHFFHALVMAGEELAYKRAARCLGVDAQKFIDEVRGHEQSDIYDRSERRLTPSEFLLLTANAPSQTDTHPSP